MKRKVLVTSRSFGEVSDEPIECLKKEGFEVEFYNTEFDELVFQEKLRECEALIIGSHVLSEEAIKNSNNLKIVCKHGAGLDNIDINITKKYGINVENVPAVNSNAVADLTFGLILDAGRKISYTARQVKNGIWSKIIGRDIYGKTLSLIGFGEIGKKVAIRARGFSMNVVVYDPYVNKLEEEYLKFVRLVSFEEALKLGDYISIHVPLNKDTKNLISSSEMELMKKGSFLINTSRGGIINENDLKEFILKDHIAGAALDVLDREPIDKENELNFLDSVTITSHVGMYSWEAINEVSLVAAEKIVNFFKNN
jgi:D-3-phosphoglycerate dehydrogenase